MSEDKPTKLSGLGCLLPRDLRIIGVIKGWPTSTSQACICFEIDHIQPLQPPLRHSADALELYLRLKGFGKGKVFRRGAERNIQTVIDVLGDRPIEAYSSSDVHPAITFCPRVLTTNSVSVTSTINSIINAFASKSMALTVGTPFSCLLALTWKITRNMSPWRTSDACSKTVE